MLATVKPSTVGLKSLKSPQALSPLPTSPLSASNLTNSLTIHAQATTISDSDLTSLSWLQKPGVLTSMCTALTGSPHRISKIGTTAIRRPRQGKTSAKQQVSNSKAKEADKMVNVILNVRNRRYNENGEEVHKPPLSFACMIFMALESSPTKTLPVKEIYDWIVWKFPFYRTAASGWKNSIRHNLSLNKCFKKVDRYSTRVSACVVQVFTTRREYVYLLHYNWVVVFCKPQNCCHEYILWSCIIYSLYSNLFFVLHFSQRVL